MVRPLLKTALYVYLAGCAAFTHVVGSILIGKWLKASRERYDRAYQVPRPILDADDIDVLVRGLRDRPK